MRHAGLRRWGTRVCSAVRTVVASQAGKAHSLGLAAALGRQAPPAVPPSARHSFVLLTDGDADDKGEGLDAAAALVRYPPFEHGGFRALLVRRAALHGGVLLPARAAGGLGWRAGSVSQVPLRLDRL